MRGILFEAPRRIRVVEDVAVPVPADGEVLVHCTHVGLCGSNMPQYTAEGRWAKSTWPGPVGWSGHENVGLIVQSRLPGWPEGTPVLAQSRDHHGYVESIVAQRQSLARLPEEASDLAPYIVAQPLATVLRALSKTEPVINQRCAVVGQGPIGLLFTWMLRRSGARQVIALDKVGWRLDWSRRLGASAVVDTSQEDAVEAVRALTDGEMVDFAIEAADTPEALTTAAYLLRREGRLCPFGVPRYETQEFPWLHALHNELRVVTSHGSGCMRFFQAAVDLVASEGTEVTQIVTPRLPWDQAPEAFAMYADPAKHVGSLKVVLEL